MPTLVFPLSRIEGHAQVVIEFHGGEVVSARFQAMEVRGFQYLVKGVPAEQMAVIVPRICGVCSTAHHLAAVKALEDVSGVTPPPLALEIRELLMIGQLVQNQATSLFIFTMPDRAGVSSIFQLEGADLGALLPGSQLAASALAVRRVGTNLITLAGGQFIHPVKAVVGGVSSGIPAEAAAAMRQEIEKALPLACQLFDVYTRLSLELGERIGTWGDDAPTHSIAATGDRRPDYTGDVIRVVDPEGRLCDRFAARDFRTHLAYEDTDYSYAGRTTYHGSVLRANSLARVNMVTEMGTPRADAYLAQFRKSFGWPAHAILLYDLARGIELVYALERALEILSRPLDRGDTAVSHSPRDGTGHGVVEAPRGPLIHRYVVEKGLIAEAEFIIPTVHNVRAIERALEVAARRYVSAGRVDMELERAVGRVVRAFDPCIACATH